MVFLWFSTLCRWKVTKDLSQVLRTLELLKQRFGHVFFVHFGADFGATKKMVALGNIGIYLVGGLEHENHRKTIGKW